MILVNKLANKFFREIKRLKNTEDIVTGFKREGDVWPFGWSHECSETECYKRADGLWQQHAEINTHAKNDKGTFGYKIIFLWRIKPNYNCGGRPICTSDQQQAFLNESETDKVLVAQDGYEFVWRWNTIRLPTEIVWGMEMGVPFYELRKDGKVIVQSPVKCEFLRLVKSYSYSLEADGIV